MATLLTDLRIALMNLIQHRRRSSLLGAAIATGTCLFVVLTALATGVRQTMLDTATALSTGHINIAGFFKPTSAHVTAIVADYKQVAQLVRRTLPELSSMVERGRGMGKLVSENSSAIPALIIGVDIDSEPRLPHVLDIESGDLHQLAQPNTVLLFDQQAKELGVKAGDSVTITAGTARGVANTLDCRVAAIAHDVGTLSRFRVYVSNESLRALYQLPADATGLLQIELRQDHVKDTNALTARLRRALKSAGYEVMEPDARMFYAKLQSMAHEDWTGQTLDVTTWEDELSFMLWPLRVLQGVSALLLLILLVVIVAGVTNTLWIVIRERTREIGTLRAIGMQRIMVVRLFLLEAALLGALGGTAGAVLGAILTGIVNAAHLPIPVAVQIFLMRETLHFTLEPSTLACAVALITLVSGAAALFPSLRAARRKPIEAMAHFG